MSIVKPLPLNTYGSYIPGTTVLNAPTTLPVILSPGYTRNQKPQGYVIGGRSAQTFYHFSPTTQTFVLVEWGIWDDPPSFELPITGFHIHPLFQFLASINWNQNHSISGFNAGHIVMKGFVGSPFGESWRLGPHGLLGTDYTWFLPPGNVNIDEPMTDALYNAFNTLVDPFNPGQFGVEGGASTSFLSSIQCRLFHIDR